MFRYEATRAATRPASAISIADFPGSPFCGDSICPSFGCIGDDGDDGDDSDEGDDPGGSIKDKEDVDADGGDGDCFGFLAKGEDVDDSNTNPGEEAKFDDEEDRFSGVFCFSISRITFSSGLRVLSSEETEDVPNNSTTCGRWGVVEDDFFPNLRLSIFQKESI